MANTTANVHGTAGFSLHGIASSIVARVKTASARSAAYTRTFKELSHLSDRELTDIGLSRCMIHDIAKEEANRCV